MKILLKIIKIILFAFAALVLFDLGLYAGVKGFDYYKSYPARKLAKSVERLEKERELLYKNDVYGGKTPEETFEMYVAALKKGDLELASKYFVVDKQNAVLNNLELLRQRNQIDDYIKRVDSLNKKWRLDAAGSSQFSQSYFIASDNINIQFSLNISSKVWKIYSA
jgi:hypothetical protein